jgi:predicted dehydrogenase
MANPLKVGMIGLGGIAHTHVPGWSSSPYTELVAGSDVAPSVFPAWREKYGMARFYEDPANDQRSRNRYCRYLLA